MTTRARTPGSLAWFGLLAPPIAWAVQLVAGYSFEEAGCGRPDTSLWGVSIDPLTGIVVAVCGIVVVLGGLASLASLLRRGPDERGVSEFIASAGVLGSVVFLVAIVLSALALIHLNGCSTG